MRRVSIKNQLANINNNSIYAYNYIEIKHFNEFMSKMNTVNLALKQAVQAFNIKN